MATMATGAWLAPGNRVEVMLNGDGTYLHLWKDLRSAQQSITLQLYYGAALSTRTGRSTTNRHGSSSKTTWRSSTASSREFIRCCRATLKPSDRDQRGFGSARIAIRLMSPLESDEHAEGQT
jgi:phosphatidylserine/phosphatidylglycerophosphate/cardiolipin synthase-like enzyme